jgi:hypothetical protein
MGIRPITMLNFFKEQTNNGMGWFDKGMDCFGPHFVEGNLDTGEYMRIIRYN